MTNHFIDKKPQHTLGNVVIGDYAVSKGTDRGDISRRPSQHPFRVFADRQDLVRIAVDRHYRRFPQDDPLPFDIDQHVRRAKIDTDIYFHPKHAIRSFPLVIRIRFLFSSCIVPQPQKASFARLR